MDWVYFSLFCVFKQKTAYEMRIRDWSSDVCSSDLPFALVLDRRPVRRVDPQQDRRLALVGRFEFREERRVGAGVHDLVVQLQRLDALVVEAAPGDGPAEVAALGRRLRDGEDRKSTSPNSSH